MVSVLSRSVTVVKAMRVERGELVSTTHGLSMDLPPTVLARVAERFKLLSEMSRLQILCALKSGPKSVNEIVEITQMGQANVSKHLKLLAQGGILARNQDGVSAYYHISDPTILDLCDVVYQCIFKQVESELSNWNQSKS